MGFSRSLSASGLVAVCLCGCANPEAECREGVARMKEQLTGVVGSAGNKSIHAPTVRAHTHVDVAQTQLATGNFEGCVASLEKARKVIGE